MFSLKKIHLLPLILLCLTACDKIEGPVHEPSNEDTTCVFGADTTPVRKKVLLEDYTGFTCGNCPAAGVYLNDTLRPLHGDSLIVISVHANFFAIPCTQSGGACPSGRPGGSFETDFRCTAGEDWYTDFLISTNPVGLIDRLGYPSGMMTQKTQWATKVNNEFARAPEAKVRIQNTYDAATRKLRACVESKILNNVTDTFKLEVVVIEDSVIDWQLWYNHVPSEFVSDYVHRHVLRTTLNGSYGTVIASGVIEAGTTVVNGYSINLDPAWNASHCAVVAFIYKASNYRVLQVEESEIE